MPGVAAAPVIVDAVYIKYSSSTALCYCMRYEGRDRGVLVQLGLSSNFNLGRTRAMTAPHEPRVTAAGDELCILFYFRHLLSQSHSIDHPRLSKWRCGQQVVVSPTIKGQ